MMMQAVPVGQRSYLTLIRRPQATAITHTPMPDMLPAGSAPFLPIGLSCGLSPRGWDSQLSCRHVTATPPATLYVASGAELGGEGPPRSPTSTLRP